jgi:histidinol-phosphate aminotransferase
MRTNLVRTNIQQLQPYSSARSEFDGEARIFLDANEWPYPNGLNRYPDPLQKKLKKEIEQWRQVPSEQLFLGNGSDEAIDLLIRIFCEPGKDHILVLPPTYGMYKVCAAVNNVEVRSVPLDADFQPNEQALMDAFGEQSKLLFLCSPNNPTGKLLNPEIVDSLIRSFPGIVVVDEAYIDFADQESWSRRLDEFDNLVVLQTFSKAMGHAGIRLGMAFAQEWIVQLLNNVKLPYNVNTLTQQAALQLLEKREEQEAGIREVIKNRNQLLQQLSELPLVDTIFPSDSNFLLVRFREDPGALFLQLREEGIIVRDRRFQPGCANCLRFTVGTEAENEQLLETLLRVGAEV